MPSKATSAGGETQSLVERLSLHGPHATTRTRPAQTGKETTLPPLEGIFIPSSQAFRNSTGLRLQGRDHNLKEPHTPSAACISFLTLSLNAMPRMPINWRSWISCKYQHFFSLSAVSTSFQDISNLFLSSLVSLFPPGDLNQLSQLFCLSAALTTCGDRLRQDR